MKKSYGLNIRVTRQTRDRLAQLALATEASKTDVVTVLIDTAYRNLEKRRAGSDPATPDHRAVRPAAAG